MYVVVRTTNVSEKGKAYRCEEEKEGIIRLKQLYLKKVKSVSILDRKNTYINKEFTYAQVSDGLEITRFRLIGC